MRENKQTNFPLTFIDYERWHLEFLRDPYNSYFIIISSRVLGVQVVVEKERGCRFGTCRRRSEKGLALRKHHLEMSATAGESGGGAQAAGLLSLAETLEDR